jgi:hypothetical protein
MAVGVREQRIRNCYRFFVQQEQAGTTFTSEQIAAVTAWKDRTIKTYLNKKLRQLVHRGSAGLRVSGITAFTEDEFVRLMSQNDEVSADPKRPTLAPVVEALVRKARESALLALHVYNSPSTVFRTEGFTVLMVIAWTSLFHAIFEKRQVDYFYMEADGLTAKVIDGDKKAWELATCMKRLWAEADHAVRRNLDFFIRLRNRIEHRYVPAIDPHVAGECQALLLNFDELLVSEFGNYFAIRDSISVPLQTSSVRTAAQSEALRKLQAKHFDDVKDFIDMYRDGLPPSVYENQQYSFRVFLVPKTGNHRSSSDVAVEFIKLSDNPEEMKAVEKQIVAIKEKQVPVVNADLLKAKEVAKEVAGQLGKPFNLTHHFRASVRYRVRKEGASRTFDATGCDTRYCIPDSKHKDYGWTRAWVNLLVEKLADPGEYSAVTKRAPGSSESTGA